MRESCSCGADIRGRRSDVLAWRREHRCVDVGAPNTSGGSQVEHAYQPIGFRPETA